MISFQEISVPTLIQPSCQRLPYLEPTTSGLTVTVSLFTQIHPIGYLVNNHSDQRKKREMVIKGMYLISLAARPSVLKSTQHKKLPPNALWFTYQNLKSWKPQEENKTKNIKMLNILVKKQCLASLTPYLRHRWVH